MSTFQQIARRQVTSTPIIRIYKIRMECLDIVINHTADVFRYKGPEPHPFKADGKYEFSHWHKISPGEGLGPPPEIAVDCSPCWV